MSKANGKTQPVPKPLAKAETRRSEKLAVYEVLANMIQCKYEFADENRTPQDDCYKRAGEILTSDDFGAPELEAQAIKGNALRLLARVRRNELKEWLADYRAMKESAAAEAVPVAV